MPDNNLIFRILMGIILISFVTHRAYYTRKYQVVAADDSPPEEPGPGWKIPSLLAVLGLAATFLYIITPGWMAWSSIQLPAWLEWSQNTLGENWSDRALLMKGHQMMVSGPCQWVRHPIYSSFLLILGSPFLISAHWFIRGTWIMMMALDISAHIKIEEQLMITRCGD